MHDARLRSSLIASQLCKPISFSRETPDPNAAVEKVAASLRTVSRSFPKWVNALPGGQGIRCRLPDSLNKDFIEWHFAKHYSLFSAWRRDAGEGTDLMRPPVVEGGYLQDSQIVPVHR